MKTASEIRYGMKTEGEQVKLSQIEGADIIVLEVSLFTSDFAPGACVQCEGDGNPFYFLTWSQVVVEALTELSGNEPYQARVMAHQSATGRKFYTLE